MYDIQVDPNELHNLYGIFWPPSGRFSEKRAEQYGIAFRADDAELCKTIEDAVAQLVENGTYAEIAAKYPDIQNNLTLLG